MHTQSNTHISNYLNHLNSQSVTIQGDAPSVVHNFKSPFWNNVDDPLFVPQAWDYERLAPQPAGDQEVSLPCLGI